jgi:UDP-glucose 4-epimerase
MEETLGEILVTGGAGYIGSVITEILVRRGRKTVVLDNLTQGHCAAVAPGATLVEADLLDRPALKKLFAAHDFEAVVHLAAVSVVEDSVAQPLRYYRENVGGLLNLLEAMQEAKVRQLVFSSTASVYGLPEQIPITEHCQTRPVNPYGWTKLMSEHILADQHSAQGHNYVALRYFNVAGATKSFGEVHLPETHLIPRVLEVACGQRPHLEIYGTDYDTADGTCIRDYIDVRDIAEAHLVALDQVRKGCALYNLGSNRGYSVREVVACTEKVTGRKIPCVKLPRRPGDPPILLASYDKIQVEHGWQPRRGLEEMISSAWAWRVKHPMGYRKETRPARFQRQGRPTHRPL